MKRLSKTFETAKELHQILMNHSLVVEYKKYQNIINSNPKYKELDLELRNMQKEIINNYSKESIELYKKKKEQFLNDPILNNYLSLKEELNILLNTLQDIINDNL